ncbi:histidine phosphatase family protein [Alphaproteobacteria bacterium GH1-50]|uniref:Histidine phosphatase family protein n=1 Tax=Kangsaoukella pontilimi TaxID=2691042 RepID=A0A7C9IQP8_9RHOB|nr:histidine phosphatase family protein [Kangsaoukella pontilimi]MXQ09510.1 histidine phosphatase family protein [Kangsaoukella pontilimi]
MGEIILVRHGQANSHATNEADYDRLSPLGHRQAACLGDWMREHGYAFDHVLSGTLRRHRETVAGMGFDAEEDARLNELDYYKLSDDLHRVKGEPHPTGDTFGDHMPKVFAAWAAAEIEGAEPYAAFEARIGEMLTEAAVPGRRLLAVTSGGVIGMVLRHVLGLDLLRMSQVMLPIWNTSIHRLHVRGDEPMLAGYNGIPHLERPDLADYRTYY